MSQQIQGRNEGGRLADALAKVLAQAPTNVVFNVVFKMEAFGDQWTPSCKVCTVVCVGRLFRPGLSLWIKRASVLFSVFYLYRLLLLHVSCQIVHTWWYFVSLMFTFLCVCSWRLRLSRVYFNYFQSFMSICLKLPCFPDPVSVLDTPTVVGIAFAAFVIGALLTGALWFIYSHTGRFCTCCSLICCQSPLLWKAKIRNVGQKCAAWRGCQTSCC